MALTYDQFKDYVIRTLWREGDVDLTSDMDQLILEAEARMSRDLRIEDNTTQLVTQMTSNAIALPDDYQQIRSVTLGANIGMGRYMQPQQFNTKVAAGDNGKAVQPYYTVIEKQLMVLGNVAVGTPLDLTLLYYNSVPPFVSTVDSVIYTKYPDVYLAAVLTCSWAYLRQDERAAAQEAKYGVLAESIANNEIRRSFAGSPLHAPLPGVVA